MSMVRRPAVAGQFYPASREGCLAFLGNLRIDAPASTGFAALVPHAGWVYSGETASLSVRSVAESRPETVVIFGAVHVHDRNDASLYADGEWLTPFGSLRVDSELADRLRRHRLITVDPSVHRYEHSIEVELPLVRHFIGDVRIVPLMVAPGAHAAEIGRVVATEAAELGRRVAFLGSTDLTHYGPAFGFEPEGHGEPGIRWARDVNDRRFIRYVANLEADAVVPEAHIHRNACGSGAVAATIAAAELLGATEYVELRHITSADIEVRHGGRPVNSVGYEAGVFARGAASTGTQVDSASGPTRSTQ